MKKERLDSLRLQIEGLVEEYAELFYAPKKFEPDLDYVPPSGKLLGSAELKAMVNASLDGWLTTGRFNHEFERKLAKRVGVRSALTVNSGSSANLVAFMALTSPKLGDRAIGAGDEVITVAGGFPTTVNPIIQSGAVPVFVDIEIGTYNINPNLIESAITSKTKAIVLAHTLGNPFDLDRVKSICQKNGLWLIEDCCDALGSTYRGKQVGTFGDLGTLSFYPAHHITMGEGGAVFTRDPKLSQIAESIRDWGRDCFCPPGKDDSCGKRFCWQLGDLPAGYDHKYTYSHLGYNLKISDMQAACGVAQLERVDDFIERRRANFSYLYAGLKDLEELLILPSATTHSDPSWFGFPITIRESSGISRLAVTKSLEANRVGSRLLFAGNLIRQPYMKGRIFKVHDELKETDRAMHQTFWIGLQPSLTQDMLDHTIAVIKKSIKPA